MMLYQFVVRSEYICVSISFCNTVKYEKMFALFFFKSLQQMKKNIIFLRQLFSIETDTAEKTQPNEQSSPLIHISTKKKIHSEMSDKVSIISRVSQH